MEFNPDINIEQLNRYLDGELSDADKLAIEQNLQTDAAFKARLQNLVVAREAIKSTGLKNRIADIQRVFKAENAVTETAKVVPMKPRKPIRAMLSAAAAVVVIVAGYTIFQLVATSNQSVYERYYVQYHLPVQRGDETTDATTIDSLYSAGNYNQLASVYATLQQPTQKEHFLAGMAALNVNQPANAVTSFEKLRQVNQQSSDKLFEQESDYYLALAHIKNGNIDAAEKLLQQIKQNPNHLYYKNAAGISKISLKVLELKN